MNIYKILIFCAAPFIALISSRILITFSGFVFGFEFNRLDIEMKVVLCVVTLIFCFATTAVCVVEIQDWLSSGREE